MSIAEGLADSPTRNRVLGECRYFRAYIYLCLVTRNDLKYATLKWFNLLYRVPH